MFGFEPFKENKATNPNTSSKEARGKAQQDHQDFCQEKGRNRSMEIFKRQENSLVFLVPRNNKLSQVTAFLFLGPKGAAVSYSLNIKKHTELNENAENDQRANLIVISFLTTQDIMANCSMLGCRNPVYGHTPGHV